MTKAKLEPIPMTKADRSGDRVYYVGENDLVDIFYVDMNGIDVRTIYGPEMPRAEGPRAPIRPTRPRCGR